jgi:PAS domain S-box-containing protein
MAGARSWWSALSLRSKGLIVVALPVLPVTFFWSVIAAGIFWQAPPANTPTRRLEVQADTARVGAALARAEAAARASSAAGDPRPGATLSDARAEVDSRLAALDDRLLDPGVRGAFGRLRAQVIDALAAFAAAEVAPDADAREASLVRGAALAEEARAALDVLEAEQTALTSARTAANRRRGWFWLVVLLTGSAVCVGGGFAAALAVVRSVRRRADILMHEANRLANGEVIDDLALGDDEVGQLAERLRLISYRLRQREHDLRDASRSLDEFFNVSRDLFCIAGFDGYFKRLNPAWTIALGHSLDDLTLRPFIDWVHPDDRQKTLSELSHLTTGHDTLSFENRYRHADGSYRWLLWTSHPDPATGAIYASARDITEYRLAMDQLAAANHALAEQAAQLEASNRELEAFSYSVSHDLRAPLRAIDGFAQVIDEDQANRLDQHGRDALRRVRAAAQRMGTLIDELLNLSRLSRMDMARESVDLSALASGVLTELGEREPDRCPDVRVQPGLAADGDPRMLRIALQNLLDNAWKYTGRTAGPRIEVGERSQGQTRVFYVRDNGAGFDMRYAARLFGAFQRLHSEREFQGTGVGLATVQRVVRRHGGEIWAEAAPNAGATFFFTLGPGQEDANGSAVDSAR